MIEGDPIWMELAALDVSPRRALAVHDVLSMKIRQTNSGLADSLKVAFPMESERITAVLETAPHILGYGSSYQWATAVHRAIAGDDRASFRRLFIDFSRFEIGAAILSNGSYTLSDLAARELAIRHEDGVVAVPLVGALELTGSPVEIVRGETEVKIIAPSRIGGVRLDAYELNYRLARSKSQFNLDRAGVWEAAHEELETAEAVARILVPGLFDRYLTDVVPLVRTGQISNAGTDEAAPFVMYTSFERSPVDMVACLAHEEAHALINSAEKLLRDVLPETIEKMNVPWKPGMLRSLSNVIHGLVSFGRAAQVRNRAEMAGLGSQENSDAFRREAGWVREVTDDLRRGSLGPLPDWLFHWMECNVAALEVSPVAAPERQRAFVRSGSASGEGNWLVFTSGTAVAAATEIYGRCAMGRWDRGSGEFSDHDRIELTVDHLPALVELTTRDIPRLLSQEFGVAARLTSVKAHRHRQGDSIHLHSDHQSGSGVFRAVLGVSVLSTDGGELRICDSNEDPLVGLPLRLGDCLVFDLRDPCYHEVTELRSNSFRFTLVATYASDDGAQ